MKIRQTAEALTPGYSHTDMVGTLDVTFYFLTI